MKLAHGTFSGNGYKKIEVEGLNFKVLMGTGKIIICAADTLLALIRAQFTYKCRHTYLAVIFL